MAIALEKQYNYYKAHEAEFLQKIDFEVVECLGHTHYEDYSDKT